MRIEAWRIDYAPDTLRATSRLHSRIRLPCGHDCCAPPVTTTVLPTSVLTLTAIILLLRPLDVWWLAPFVLAAACLSLVGSRRQAVADDVDRWSPRSSPHECVVVWPLSDNHIYLLAYWCLAIGLALSGAAPAATLSSEQPLACSARAFAMAVLWKAVLSPDYIDGRFFRVTLLTDERFADASLVFGGLSRDQMAREPQVPRAAAGRRRAARSAAIRRAAAAARVRRDRDVGRAAPRDPGRAGLCLLPVARAARARRDMPRCSRSASRRMRWRRWPGSAGCSRRWDSRTAVRVSARLRGAYLAVFVLILLYSEIPWTGVLAIGRPPDPPASGRSPYGGLRTVEA